MWLVSSQKGKWDPSCTARFFHSDLKCLCFGLLGTVMPSTNRKPDHKLLFLCDMPPTLEHDSVAKSEGDVLFNSLEDILHVTHEVTFANAGLSNAHLVMDSSTKGKVLKQSGEIGAANALASCSLHGDVP